MGKNPIKENKAIIHPEVACEIPNDFVSISGSQASIAKELKAPIPKMIVIAHATGQRATDSVDFDLFSREMLSFLFIKSQGMIANNARRAQLPVETLQPTAWVSGTATSEGSPALR